MVDVSFFSSTDTTVYLVDDILVEQLEQHDASARIQHLIACSSVGFVACSMLYFVVENIVSSNTSE